MSPASGASFVKHLAVTGDAMGKHIEWNNGVFGTDNIGGTATFYAWGGGNSVKADELAKVNSRGVSVFALRLATECTRASLEQIEDAIRTTLRLHGIQDRTNWDRTRESMKAFRTHWPKITRTFADAVAGELEFG